MILLSIPEYIITGFILCLSFYLVMRGIEIMSRCINKLFDWSVK
jgi:hypothetical protein